MRLCRPRTFGSCWLALTLWRELELDRFWNDRLPASREGTRWDEVLFVLAAYRLLSPGSEWRLHREWRRRRAQARPRARRARPSFFCNVVTFCSPEPANDQSSSRAEGRAATALRARPYT